MKKFLLLSTALLLTLVLVACGGGSDSDEIIMDEPVPSGAENLMVIKLEFSDDDITPNTITVPADTDVLLVISNTDTVELNEDHNLVAPDIELQEIIVVPGQTVRRVWHTAATPGEYRAGCTIHSWIDMTVVIE